MRLYYSAVCYLPLPQIFRLTFESFAYRMAGEFFHLLWQEILLCKVSFKNEPIDRRVILYLNNCDCGRKYCNENAAYVVKSHLKKVTLKDAAVDFMIEYVPLLHLVIPRFPFIYDCMFYLLYSDQLYSISK